MPIDFEALTKKTIHERHQLYKNALKQKAKGNPEADKILALLKESGLPFSEPGGLSSDDPITLAMYDIVHSKEGEQAMRKAVDKGMPPMAGVDPLFAVALGIDYGGHNQATATAGDLVAIRMRSLGFIDTGKAAKLPDFCVAKTARMFLKK